MAHGIKPETAFQHRSRWDSDCHSRRGCSRLRPVFYLGDIMKAGLAPLLPLPAHRLARRVLRLEPHLRWPAAIGRVARLQPHAADMLEHGRTVTCQVLAVPDGSRPGLASLASRRLRSISGKSRRSSPSCSIRSKANSTASLPRRWLRNGWKSGVPSPRAITASPSMTTLGGAAGGRQRWPRSDRPSHGRCA